MALWIQNISDPMPEDDQVHTYRLMIGETELAQFKHIRSHGAAQCLRLAVDALIESEGETDGPLRQQMMRRKLAEKQAEAK